MSSTPQFLDLVQVEVVTVNADLETSSANVTLRSIRPPVGMAVVKVSLEAGREIERARVGRRGERPSSSELLARILQELESDLISVRIVTESVGVYLSEIELRGANHQITIDSRPSDALSLALRSFPSAPIYIVRDLLTFD